MKRIITLILFGITAHFVVEAQDIIILRSGEEIASRVEEVGTEVIKYKKFDNLAGPTYSIKKSDVFMIRYESGSKDVFNEAETQDTPRANINLGQLADKSFNFNPLGFLQFGPIIQYEKKVSPNSVVAPYFRYAYLGVLTHLAWTGFDDGKLSPATFGVGLGLKGFSEEVGNTMYYGGFLDYNIAKANYGVGDTDETQEKYAGLALISNFGYRWRKASGSYVNVGLFAGAAFTLKDEERYVYTGELFAKYNETAIFAMLELSFGFGSR